MVKMKIYINKFNDIKEFVNEVNRSSCDVTLSSGRYIVDGKSIMGIFSLDLSKPIDVEIEDNLYGRDKSLPSELEDELESAIKRFEYKEGNEND